MPQIMSLFVFQSSRRQLLAAITAAINSKEEEEAEGEGQQKEAGEEQREPASGGGPVPRRTRSSNLRAAAAAADAQVRRLEFWSDVKGVVRDGEAPLATGGRDGKAEGEGVEKGKWPAAEWEGVDQSGPGHP